MRTNVARSFDHVRTHEGAQAFPHLTAEQRLRRSVMSCMLFEGEFYEDGQTIADRISEAASAVSPQVLAKVAIEARSEQNLRHVPLLLCVELAKRGGKVVGDTLAQVIQRADEISEFIALYWKAKKTPLSKQVKRGLALAFQKFDAYQLAKYDRAATVRLRDVLFLVHAKPKDEQQAANWKALVAGTLPAPDTWEVALSGGADKRETWERMLREGTLGYLALLRNLRNMVEAKVDAGLIREAILARKGGADRVLPFRYFAAAKAAPLLEPAIDRAMLAALSQAPKLKGKTVVVVDVSGSMEAGLSVKSDMTRMLAACSLAAILREQCENPVIYATAGSDISRTHATALVPARHGIGLADAIAGMCRPLGGGGIFIKQVMDFIAAAEHDADRVIVVTDEQDCGIGASDAPAKARLIAPRNYMLNVASNKNGVGYGPWTHVDGWSENVIRWIVESENDASSVA